jgi:protein-tyrosine phosphatase
MPKPSSEWLVDDVTHYRSIGVCKIISLLTNDEVAELGLAEERHVCGQNEISFLQHSIEDRGLPATDDFAMLVENTFVDLKNGVSIAIHCRAGIGRSGLLAACILQKTGLTADEAIEAVSEARGVAVPDTADQLDFVRLPIWR